MDQIICFCRLLGHNLGYALIVYRLIGATLIGNFLMIPSLIELKILVKRPIFRTLGNKGLSILSMP